MRHGRLSDARLRALASEIRDNVISAEPDWLEWKKGLNLTTSRARFQLSKQILEWQNRLPESARRNCDG